LFLLNSFLPQKYFSIIFLGLLKIIEKYKKIYLNIHSKPLVGELVN